MIYNKYGFKPGDIAILDADHLNWSKVKIIAFIPNGMFTVIFPEEGKERDCWEVMTNRLSPIKY